MLGNDACRRPCREICIGRVRRDPDRDDPNAARLCRGGCVRGVRQCRSGCLGVGEEKHRLGLGARGEGGARSADADVVRTATTRIRQRVDRGEDLGVRRAQRAEDGGRRAAIPGEPDAVIGNRLVDSAVSGVEGVERGDRSRLFLRVVAGRRGDAARAVEHEHHVCRRACGPCVTGDRDLRVDVAAACDCRRNRGYEHLDGCRRRWVCGCSDRRHSRRDDYEKRNETAPTALTHVRIPSSIENNPAPDPTCFSVGAKLRTNQPEIKPSEDFSGCSSNVLKLETIVHLARGRGHRSSCGRCARQEAPRAGRRITLNHPLSLVALAGANGLPRAPRRSPARGHRGRPRP